MVSIWSPQLSRRRFRKEALFPVTKQETRWMVPALSMWRCYFDISIGNRYAGRIVFGLYSDVVLSLDQHTDFGLHKCGTMVDLPEQ